MCQWTLGCGKTFAWNQYLKDAQTKGKIVLNRYSYVSLFGVNSLDELKYAVFENSVKSSDIGIDLTLKNLQSNKTYVADYLAKRFAGIMQQTPFLKNYLGGIVPMFFSAIRETIICIDDFERRGSGLSVRDVLGLVNNLKELKKCKVCFILNDEALEEDEADFRKYLEKVVDVTLKFTPSAEECARIALPEKTDTSSFLAECCIKLGISNIRVIKKIERSVRKIEPMVVEFDKQVLTQAVHSLALLGWSIYEPTKAPSVDYLEKKQAFDLGGIDERKPLPANEAAWNALLGAYDFNSMDEFDVSLLRGIRSGFFDPTSVRKSASSLNDKIKAGNLDASFQAAWRKYHDSFDDNQDEVLDALYESFFKGVHYITPMNMNSTVALFKTLGRKDQADSMLKHYLDARSGQTELFDLRNYPFSDAVSDADVIQAFEIKHATLRKKAQPRDILLRIADTNSWNPEDITTLSGVPIDDYYHMLKTSKGHDLRRIVSACLLFDKFGNATPDYKEISNRAKQALKRIGLESSINARRVRAYGVEVAASVPDKQDLSQTSGCPQ